MHDLHNYLCNQLSDMIGKRSVVVFYDPRCEFTPFFDRELEEVGKGYGELPRISLGEQMAFLARFAGSFCGLRGAVEPLVSRDRPDPLILYMPGVTRDRQGSILMEIEKAGAVYEPQLKRLARNVLRRRFTDGDIDEMLVPENL